MKPPVAEDAPALTRRLIDALAPEPDVVLAYLYGSVAAGRTHPDSDVDIAVLFTGESPDTVPADAASVGAAPVGPVREPPTNAALARRLSSLEGRLMAAVQTDRLHVTQLNQTDALFAYQVVAGGTPILIRDPSRLAAFEGRTAARFADTAKLRRLEWDTLRVAAGLEHRMPVDRALVVRKLTQLEGALQELRTYIPTTPEEYRTDALRRRAVERVLHVIAETAADVNAHIAATTLQRVPTDYHTSFRIAAEAGAIPPDLAGALAPSTGVRNRLVHEYDEIDDAVVFAAAGTALDLYPRYVTSITAFLAAAQ